MFVAIVQPDLCPGKLPSVDRVALDTRNGGIHDSNEQVEKDSDNHDIVGVPHEHCCVSRYPFCASNHFRMTRIKERPKEGLDGAPESEKLTLFVIDVVKIWQTFRFVSRPYNRVSFAVVMRVVPA